MIVGEQEARALIKPRPKSSHKGDYGSVLLIGGFYPWRRFNHIKVSSLMDQP